MARAPVVGQTTNPAAQPQQPAQTAAIPTSGPNANPLDLFPQVKLSCGRHLINLMMGKLTSDLMACY